MKDEIIINIRALIEEDRQKIYEILRYRLFEIPDEINDEALEVLKAFKED